ncbi:ABC transporter permease [Candidatus Methanoprimaticola sp. MG2]|uniref:ABC transporter permease n=1 Tax=Candidatus Methanoprimaticola sp. MG2 TaxID=3228838 RepID=UPI0039C6B9FD
MSLNSVEGIIGLRQSFRNIRDNIPFLRSMVIRDLKGRYQSTKIGLLWHIVAPAITVVLIYVLFTSLRTYLDPDYWVFIVSGLIPFMFFRNGPSRGSTAILSRSGMVKKMAFPRELVVMAQLIDSLISLSISYAIMLIVVLMTGHDVPLRCMLYSVPVIYLSAVFVAGTMLIVSSLAVYFRDFQFLINSMARVMFWVTPVMFAAESVSGIMSTLLAINPVTYYVECFHALVYYGRLPQPETVLMCILFSAAIFLVGLFVFNRLKGRFAEVL